MAIGPLPIAEITFKEHSKWQHYTKIVSWA